MRKPYREWKADREAQELYERDLQRSTARKRKVQPAPARTSVSARKSTPQSKNLLVRGLFSLALIAITIAGIKLGLDAVPKLSAEAKVKTLSLSEKLEKERTAFLANPGDTPPELIELLDKNAETLPFIKEYPNRDTYIGQEFKFSVKKGVMPDYKQWDTRWGFDSYGNSIMAISGCGPTSLSLISAYLTGDDSNNPLSIARMAEKDGHYLPGTGTKWELMNTGAASLGLYAKEVPLSENSMKNHLDSKHPIIVSVGPGDFTSAGHYIVLYGVNEDGSFKVMDVNSVINSEKSWTYDQLAGQIKNMWAYSSKAW